MKEADPFGVRPEGLSGSAGRLRRDHEPDQTGLGSDGRESE